ncbi:MAG: NAD(P)-dependent dehydrogenase (short-subunit alcohol dehydrogenase family) [Acidimicrobiales bacterium]
MVAVRYKGWGVADLPDLTGKIVVVTGANSGIGLEAARVFSRRGATVVLACRDEAKGTAAAHQLRAAGDALAVVMSLDMADLGSIEAFAVDFDHRFGKLDILVNNAGIMAVPYGKTADGFERQFGTNHLGHFALTGRLLVKLLAAPSARVVTVSSIAHKEADMDFDDLMFNTGVGYEPMKAYRRSKLANLLFAYELDRRVRAAGHPIASLAVHPGVSVTSLFDGMSRWSSLAKPLAKLLLQGADAGALPTLRAAVDPAAEGGQYYGPLRRKETTGPPELAPSTDLARDEHVAAELWNVSERLTGVRYLS